ncbi:MAG: type 2 isopentenyl-diphosphate Delta-isomerase [Gammaproteobacteria bacterium]|jgi:isopentenyl-diphosphate delta-isomerase|nr:type 2 isopentenyl-diphosphate Delta-isomerase [Gammaproteobacteria bacterium]
MSQQDKLKAMQTNNRKREHIDVINRDPMVDRQRYFFDSLQLRHRALPELDLQDVDPSVTIMGKRLSFPLLISSMTGGDDELVQKVNRHLAEAAQITGVAMGLGSQRVMLEQPQSVASFQVRKYAPDILLLGNIGAVQLNNGVTPPQVGELLQQVQADALFLHLNPLQEAVQPEGDTNFSGLIQRIGDLQKYLDVPVVLKEVGAGLSVPDIELGLSQGIKWFDVAGRGGTSWARIEQHRRKDSSQLGFTLQDWGIPTPVALQQARPYMEQANFIASGGLRNGLDLIKSVIIGGCLGGVAKPLLAPAMESTEAVVAAIESLKLEFVTAMFLLSVQNVENLHLNDDLLLPPVSP